MVSGEVPICLPPLDMNTITHKGLPNALEVVEITRGLGRDGYVTARVQLRKIPRRKVERYFETLVGSIQESLKAR